MIAHTTKQKPISRKPLSANGAIPPGRLRVDQGLLRRTAVTISSAVTADDVARASAGNGGTTLTRTQQLDGLRGSLRALTTALYRRGQQHDAASLDEAVRHAISVATDVASERSRWARR